MIYLPRPGHMSRLFGLAGGLAQEVSAAQSRERCRRAGRFSSDPLLFH